MGDFVSHLCSFTLLKTQPRKWVLTGQSHEAGIGDIFDMIYRFASRMI